MAEWTRAPGLEYIDPNEKKGSSGGAGPPLQT